jgi:hypothetical protein
MFHCGPTKLRSQRQWNWQPGCLVQLGDSAHLHLLTQLISRVLCVRELAAAEGEFIPPSHIICEFYAPKILLHDGETLAPVNTSHKWYSNVLARVDQEVDRS